MAAKKNTNKKTTKPTGAKTTSSKATPSKQNASRPAAKPARVYKINKGLKLYNKISKDLTAYNNSLPPDKRIPYKIRRGMIKNTLYPHFKGLSARQTTYKDIRGFINSELSEFMIETNDVRNLNPASYFDIDYFLINDFLSDLVEFAYDVRVNAGEFGSTPIFNTADYEYSVSGIPEIVDNIRALEELGSGNYPKFNGVIMVKPKMQEGNRNSYYLEMRLDYNGESMPIPSEEIGVEAKQKRVTSKTKAEAERIKKAKKQINEKIGRLKKKTPMGKREPVFRKEVEKKEKQTASSKKEAADLLRNINVYIENLKGLYKDGLISKKDMQAAMKKAIALDVPQAAPVAKKIPLGKTNSKPQIAAKKAVTKKRKK